MPITTALGVIRITSTSDDKGTITVENDLLGRTVKYTDATGKVTTNTYDDYGKLTQRVGPLGTETYEYDNYDRLTKQKLDGVTFATVTYDQFSRISNVQYAAGINLSGITRDTLGRENGNTYTLASGQTLTDSINRYTSGDIQNGTENGTSKAYTYDKAGRLTGATIGSNTYTYGFGAQDSSCAATPGYDAGKDGNRTSMTVNGQTTTFCYNNADQLVSSSDATPMRSTIPMATPQALATRRTRRQSLATTAATATVVSSLATRKPPLPATLKTASCQPKVTTPEPRP